MKWLIILIILALIAIFIIDPKLEFNWFKSGDNLDGESELFKFNALQSKIQDVSAVLIEPKPLVNKILITGEIIPNEFIDIKSEISGILQAIYFKEGQFVKESQLLAKINVDELNAQKKKLEYTQSLKESVEERQAKLLEREAISQEEYDEALTELKTTGADINLIETQIKKSEIRAPFSGKIGLRQVSQGAYVTTSTVFAPLYNINPVKIEFGIPGKYSDEVTLGSEIAFSTDAMDEVFSGKVYAIDSRLDPNTRTLRLRATCPNPKGKLLPGQFAKIELELSRKNAALMVPTESIIPEIDGSKVLMVKNGKVTESKVTTGIRTENEIEIIEGISIGDTVLTSGILQIRTGSVVNVKIFN